MKPIKELTNVTKVENFSKDNIILYFDNDLSTLGDKKSFSEIYNNIYFKNWLHFDKNFYLVQRKNDNKYTLVFKDTGACLNDNLCFDNIEEFNDEFFVIQRSSDDFKTLIYKKDGKYFNSNIWCTDWEVFDDNYLLGYTGFDYDIFNIIDKKEKKLLSSDTFIVLDNFDDNLLVVKKTTSYTNEYTFIKKENGEHLNEELSFNDYFDLNNDMCLVRINDHFHFILKANGHIADNFPTLTNFFSFYNTDEFIKIEFMHSGDFKFALLRKSDCAISPLYYNIENFNKTYFSAYFDDYHFTLIKKSDLSLLCNYLCLNEDDTITYRNSEYFIIKKDDKFYLYN